MNKEQLKKQIAEMELKLQEMKEELNKPKEFEFKYPAGNTYLVGPYSIGRKYSGTDHDMLEHGKYRIKKDNAELSLQRNKEANRLEALAEQIDSDWKADWKDEAQKKFFIYYYYPENEYRLDFWCSTKTIGVPYMRRETAETICDMLNSGEFKL